MKTKIYVVTHKKFDDSIIPDKDLYQVIKVGSALSDTDAQNNNYLLDSTADNISDKNPYYCELTAYYWVWKNVKDVDVVGINHYRRYFFDYKRKSTKLSDDILTKNVADKIFAKHRAIMSFYSIKYKGINYFKKGQPIIGDWKIIEEIILKHYPEMSKSFYKCMSSRKTVYGNMIIAYKKDFDALCEWLFGVLEKYDNVLAERGEERRPRVDGYISENLLWIWSNYYYSKKDIYRLEVRNTEDDNLHYADYKNSFSGKLFHKIKENRFTLNLYRKFSLLYLLLKR